MTEHEKKTKEQLIIDLQKAEKTLEDYLEVAFETNDEVFPYEDVLTTISKTIESLK